MDRTIETTYVQDLQDARRHLSNSVESFMQAGHALKAAKEKHREQYGMMGWEEAVNQYVGISQVQADQMIASYEKFGQQSIAVLSNFVPTTLKMLSGPSVPQSARDEALELAGEGEHISMKVARDLIDEAREKARKETLDAMRTEMDKADGRIAELQRKLFLAQEAQGSDDLTESEEMGLLREQLQSAHEDAELLRVQLEQAQQKLKSRPTNEVEKQVDNPVTVAQLEVLRQRDKEQADEIRALQDKVAAYEATEKRRKADIKAERTRVDGEQVANSVRDTFVEEMNQLIDACQLGCMRINSTFADTSKFGEREWQLLSDAIGMLKQYTLLLNQQFPEVSAEPVGTVNGEVVSRD